MPVTKYSKMGGTRLHVLSLYYSIIVLTKYIKSYCYDKNLLRLRFSVKAEVFIVDRLIKYK